MEVLLALNNEWRPLGLPALSNNAGRTWPFDFRSDAVGAKLLCAEIKKYAPAKGRSESLRTPTSNAQLR
jgi:hypothetical protein